MQKFLILKLNLEHIEKLSDELTDLLKVKRFCDLPECQQKKLNELADQLNQYTKRMGTAVTTINLLVLFLQEADATSQSPALIPFIAYITGYDLQTVIACVTGGVYFHPSGSRRLDISFCDEEEMVDDMLRNIKIKLRISDHDSVEVRRRP